MSTTKNQIAVRTMVVSDETGKLHSFVARIESENVVSELQSDVDYRSEEKARMAMDSFTEGFGVALKKGKVHDFLHSFTMRKMEPGSLDLSKFPIPDEEAQRVTIQMGEDGP